MNIYEVLFGLKPKDDFKAEWGSLKFNCEKGRKAKTSARVLYRQERFDIEYSLWLGLNIS